MNKLNNKQLEKYSRQIIIDSIGIKGQKKILESKVLIIGCGGLGTSAAQYLSMSGVGTIGLVDYDTISLSNLNRQTLFREKEIGLKKVAVLQSKIKEINRDIKVRKFDTELKLSNIKKIFGEYLYVLDCTDNFKARFLINKFSYKMKKILVTAALQNFDLQASILKSWVRNKNNPCYECFLSSDQDYSDDSCDEMGIMSTVAGIGGALQANLLINDIINKNGNFSQIILLNCREMRMRKINFYKNSKCKVCSNS